MLRHFVSSIIMTRLYAGWPANSAFQLFIFGKIHGCLAQEVVWHILLEKVFLLFKTQHDFVTEVHAEREKHCLGTVLGNGLSRRCYIILYTVYHTLCYTVIFILHFTCTFISSSSTFISDTRMVHTVNTVYKIRHTDIYCRFGKNVPLEESHRTIHGKLRYWHTVQSASAVFPQCGGKPNCTHCRIH